MILDARESRDHQISRAPKNHYNSSNSFAGDDFENKCIQMNDENSLILIGIMQTKST